MDIVVKTVKVQRSESGSFTTFLEQSEAEIVDLIHFTAIWLESRGATLKCFFNFRKENAEFMQSKGQDLPQLSDAEYFSQ